MIVDPEVVVLNLRTAKDGTEVTTISLRRAGLELTVADDDDYGRRPQRRRYEEPLSVTLRKQVLSIAKSVIRLLADVGASLY